MVLFYDVGRLGDHFQDLYSGDFRDACGLGLHYLTPVGPIGLSYGYNLDRMEEESRGEWYLSVGYTF
jgi:outer membrane protein insertion porin family